MSLRGLGSYFVPLGSEYSGLYCPVYLKKDSIKEVRRKLKNRK